MTLGKKEYPKADNKGVLQPVNAVTYKIYLETNFPPATSKVNANILKQLSATVDRIELGPTTSNTPSLNVRSASIELLEECRKMLLEIDTNPALSGAKKMDERKEILELLEMIDLANSREKTWKWAWDFVSSSATKFKESLTWGNLGKAILAVTVCVVVSTLVKLGLLAVMGAFAPYAFPLVIAAVAVFCFYKAVTGLSQAWKEANKIAREEKEAKGTEVIRTVASFANSDLSTAKKELESATVAKSAAEKDYADKSQDYDNYKKSDVLPIEQEAGRLQKENARLDGLIYDLDTEISRMPNRTRAEQEKVGKKTIERDGYIAEFRKNEKAYNALSAKISGPTGVAATLQSKKDAADAAQRELARLSAPTAQHAQKKAAYDNAEMKQKMAQSRADKKGAGDTPQSSMKSRLKAGSPPEKPASTDKSAGKKFS